MRDILVVGFTYFLYNLYFFRYASLVMDRPRMKTWYVLMTFAANYGVFILCTMAQFHLIINWYIFFVCLFLEISLISKGNYLKSMTVALSGALIGLALNLFLRNILAIIMKVPLSAFDSNFDLPGNAKQYPVALGFLCAALLFFIVTRQRERVTMQEVLRDEKSLKFFFILLLTMYGYLCLNLLVYYAPGDSLVLKIWELKAGVVVMMGYYLALFFSSSMSRLEQFRVENYQAKLKLEMGKLEEEQLYAIVYRDLLTGCGTRQRAIEVLSEALMRRDDFCLCFVDLNGLKLVNDQLGHTYGDQYLLVVTQTLRRRFRSHRHGLFRYGGDEFLLAVYQQGLPEVRACLEEVQADLKAGSETPENPFSMSISFGIVKGEDYDDVEELVAAADRKMYEHKTAGKRIRGE